MSHDDHHHHRASGVGTLSELVQDSIDETVNNIHADYGKSRSKSKTKYKNSTYKL